MCVSGSLKHTVDPYREILMHGPGYLTTAGKIPDPCKIFFAAEYEC